MSHDPDDDCPVCGSDTWPCPCDDEPTTCYNTGGRCHAGCGCDEALNNTKPKEKPMPTHPEVLATHMGMAHELFRGMVAEYRDDAMAWVTIVYPESSAAVGLEGGQLIVPMLHALPGLPELAANAVAVIVSTTAWKAAPADLAGHSGPRAAGEAGVEGVGSIAMTVMCTAEGQLISVSSDYDPNTGVLGDAQTMTPSTEGRIAVALVSAMAQIVAARQ